MNHILLEIIESAFTYAGLIYVARTL